MKKYFIENFTGNLAPWKVSIPETITFFDVFKKEGSKYIDVPVNKIEIRGTHKGVDFRGRIHIINFKMKRVGCLGKQSLIHKLFKKYFRIFPSYWADVRIQITNKKDSKDIADIPINWNNDVNSIPLDFLELKVTTFIPDAKIIIKD